MSSYCKVDIDLDPDQFEDEHHGAAGTHDRRG